MTSVALAGVEKQFLNFEISGLIANYLHTGNDIGWVIETLKNRGVPPIIVQLHIDIWYATVILNEPFARYKDAVRAYKNANGLLCAFELEVVSQDDARALAIFRAAENKA